MKKITITLSTPTYAQKARRLLKTHGISSEVTKLSSQNRSGCLFGIKIDERRFWDAVDVLRRADIKYSVYNER